MFPTCSHSGTHFDFILFKRSDSDKEGCPQIHKGDPRTCAILIPAWGLKWGIQVFPLIKITMVPWFVRCGCHPHLLHFEREDKHALKCRMACEDHGRTCFAFVFACVVGKNPDTPNLNPMADDAITQGGIPGPGISFVYLWGCWSSRGWKVLLSFLISMLAIFHYVIFMGRGMGGTCKQILFFQHVFTGM